MILSHSRVLYDELFMEIARMHDEVAYRIHLNNYQGRRGKRRYYPCVSVGAEIYGVPGIGHHRDYSNEKDFHPLVSRVLSVRLGELNVAQVRKVKQGEPIAVAEGRKAFVEFKIQMKYLVKAIKEMSERNGFRFSDIDIADIAYAVFFYGSSKSWKPFMMEYLKDYPDTERLVDAIIARLDSEKRFILYRPNQNYLSVYFRNMYNAIKLIDNCGLISSEEKKDYVKILRAQLSNAELYILFFNIISRFGKKWVDNDYVTKYQLIQNLPSKYCDGYNPKDYFPEIKFEGEELCLSPFKEQIVQREN